MFIAPHLTFTTQAREAIEFYHRVFGGQLQIGTFAEWKAQDPTVEIDDAALDLLVYGTLKMDNGCVIEASDAGEPNQNVPGGEKPALGAIDVATTNDKLDELRAAFSALAEGGTVTAPLEEFGAGEHYGALVDRFGVTWNFAGTPAGKYLL